MNLSIMRYVLPLQDLAPTANQLAKLCRAALKLDSISFKYSRPAAINDSMKIRRRRRVYCGDGAEVEGDSPKADLFCRTFDIRVVNNRL